MRHYSKSIRTGVTIVIKGIFSLLPPSLPTMLYRTLLSRPYVRPFTNTIAQIIIPEKIELPEGTLFLNKKDIAISGAMVTGIFEPFEIELFRKTLKPGMTVIDIGANIGIYSVIAAGAVGPNGKVFSFEPETENFSFLSKNISANNFLHAKPIQTALSDHNGTQKLFLATDNKGSHSFVDNQSARQSIEVPVQTLDETLHTENCQKVDLIKIDTEGAEPIILDGMINTLKNNDQVILFTEVYPSRIRALKKDPLDYLNTLSNLGFSLSIIDDDDKELVPLPKEHFQSFLESFPNGESPKNIYCMRIKKAD